MAPARRDTNSRASIQSKNRECTLCRLAKKSEDKEHARGLKRSLHEGSAYSKKIRTLGDRKKG